VDLFFEHTPGIGQACCFQFVAARKEVVQVTGGFETDLYQSCGRRYSGIIPIALSHVSTRSGRRSARRYETAPAESSIYLASLA
jgi:hypothetical protein